MRLKPRITSPLVSAIGTFLVLSSGALTASAHPGHSYQSPALEGHVLDGHFLTSPYHLAGLSLCLIIAATLVWVGGSFVNRLVSRRRAMAVVPQHRRER